MKVNGFRYKAIASVPAKARDARWDVPRQFAGQMVTLAFAASDGAESGPGARYMRASDASDKSERYYRLQR